MLSYSQAIQFGFYQIPLIPLNRGESSGFCERSYGSVEKSSSKAEGLSVSLLTLYIPLLTASLLHFKPS